MLCYQRAWLGIHLSHPVVRFHKQRPFPAMCRILLVDIGWGAMQAVLRFVADAARASATADECAELQVTFYTALACDVIGVVQRVSESLAGALLPAVRAGLGRGASEHMHASALTVMACLAAHTTLSLQLLSGAAADMVPV